MSTAASPRKTRRQPTSVKVVTTMLDAIAGSAPSFFITNGTIVPATPLKQQLMVMARNTTELSISAWDIPCVFEASTNNCLTQSHPTDDLEIAASSQCYVVRVLVLTGAGVSAESGIPTFRGKGGYWRNLDATKLATPEAFARDPQLVWDWYRERRERIRNARPNAAHEAMAQLAGRTDEFLLVTQNVDDLHTRAGMAAEKMVQI